MLVHMLQYPLWLQAWILWMGIMNLGSLAFLRYRQGRWALTAFLCAAVFLEALCYVNGFNRLLGLGHLIFWTPAMIAITRTRHELPPDSAVRTWATVLLVTNTLSLIVDASDVTRYVLGERG